MAFDIGKNLKVFEEVLKMPSKIKTICCSFLSPKPTSSSSVNPIPSFSSPTIHHRQPLTHFQSEVGQAPFYVSWCFDGIRLEGKSYFFREVTRLSFTIFFLQT
ncbi:hypothetical protein V6Z11_D05G253800 [Gossypium hirsutum]